MPDKQIAVVAYSGYRGEEMPRAFMLSGECITVVDILRAWTEEQSEGRKRSRRFRLKGSDGRTHEIYHDDEAAAWFCSD